MRKNRPGLPAVLSGLTFLLALSVGCAVAPDPPPGGTGAGAGIALDETRPAEDSATETATAVNVVNAFWAEHWGEFFTGSYQSPEVYGPYDESTVPMCGGEPLGMRNAIYCHDGYIAWDAAYVAEGYAVDDAFTWVMVSHEWAHAVQDRLDPALVAAAIELQADCLAGATLAGAVQDGQLTWEADDEQGLAQVFAMLGDDTDWQTPADHGSTPERVDAFVNGLDNGVGACLPATA